MPELRIDPLTGLRVIVAGERGGRPGAWLDVTPRAAIDPERDPFLAGHEDRTPPEVYALPDDGGDGWKVRVVPNLYPALSPGEAEPGEDPLTHGRGEPELFASRPAHGAHEVIVNAPDPVSSLAELIEVVERLRPQLDSQPAHVMQRLERPVRGQRPGPRHVLPRPWPLRRP